MKNILQSTAVALSGAVVLASIVVSPSVASGQASAQAYASPSANWTAWTGCWRPDSPGARTPGQTMPQPSSSVLVCIVPGGAGQLAAGAAQVMTIESGKVAMVDTISTTAPRTRTAQGCTGPESAKWSADGHRLYLESRYDCAGGTVRSSSGMFSISPDGRWVNVESSGAGKSRSLHVFSYSPAAIPESLPQQLADAVRSTQMAIGAARSAAGAALSASDVIDASRNTDSTVVAAWILDRRQPFNVDASKLVALADVGVPSDVTDAMVAVSYPKSFTVATPGSIPGGDIPVTIATDDRATQRDVRVMMIPEYSPFGYGFSPFGFPYGYSPYGYSPYGYSPYGYSPYGYSAFGGYYMPYAGYGIYSPPVIVLKGSEPVNRGYVVKGHGYTQSQPGVQQGIAQPRTTNAPPPPPQATPSQGNANGQPAPSGRTAHERP